MTDFSARPHQTKAAASEKCKSRFTRKLLTEFNQFSAIGDENLRLLRLRINTVKTNNSRLRILFTRFAKKVPAGYTLLMPS